ncbi:MAG: ABC-F family ATP-binding cassette domain-containing protein [Sporolactobacillus sp.]
MLLIEAKQLNFSYGDKTIFQAVDFRLGEGEHIALVGQNGAGKSTFLKLITGELLADGGMLERKAALHVGVIEQHLHFQKQKTIYDVLQSAFQPLIDAEHEMNGLAESMGDPGASDELLERYGKLQEQLINQDFYTIDARIRELADGLGLTAIGLDVTVGRMSGGQLTKLSLGKLLLQQPEMLLLDEPTNYLDTAHIDWLTGYLKGYRHAFLVISHDTAFLDRIAQVVYHLENRSLTRYVGNYTSFIRQHEARQEQQAIAYRQQQREIKKLETYIQKNKARASTAKQAKSREKQLNRLDRVDPPSAVRAPHFHFHVNHQPVRVLFDMEGMRIGYDRPLFPAIDRQIVRGEKLAIIGHNGIGKTTFLRTILGELVPLAGTVHRGDRVDPGYFAQLAAPPHETALEWMKDQFPRLEDRVLRQHLAQCGVSAEHMRQSMETLSGGEESKVRIARLMLLDCNVLIFDEPTNHLDVEAKAALSEALSRYEGTVIVVSHEPPFYQSWVNKVWDVERWAVPLKGLAPFTNGLQS